MFDLECLPVVPDWFSAVLLMLLFTSGASQHVLQCCSELGVAITFGFSSDVHI
jgi:hypothetical protein